MTHAYNFGRTLKFCLMLGTVFVAVPSFADDSAGGGQMNGERHFGGMRGGFQRDGQMMGMRGEGGPGGGQEGGQRGGERREMPKTLAELQQMQARQLQEITQRQAAEQSEMKQRQEMRLAEVKLHQQNELKEFQLREANRAKFSQNEGGNGQIPTLALRK